jgi:hypothetical protein
MAQSASRRGPATEEGLTTPQPVAEGRRRVSAFSDRSAIAWAAGLFEGEGSIVTYHARRCETPKLQVQMTDHDVILRFHQTMALGRVNGPYVRAGKSWKAQWTWSVTSFESVQALVAMWWPWLGARRRLKATEVLMRARARPVVQKYRTACPRGHPYDRRNNLGSRYCLACQNATNRRSKTRRRVHPDQLRLVK